MVPSSIESAVARIKCDVVVNAAAYTAVDQAESEQDVADAVNAAGAGQIAAAAARKKPPRHSALDGLCLRRQFGRTLSTRTLRFRR